MNIGFISMSEEQDQNGKEENNLNKNISNESEDIVNKIENTESIENGSDDFQEYMREMEFLKTDFSDLEDLDLEEIEEMKEAIFEVQQAEIGENEEINIIQQSLNLEEQTIDEVEGSKDTSVEINEIIIEEPKIEDKEDQKESMLIDFSDLGKTDLNELLEMKKAVESVQQEELTSKRGKSKENQSMELSDELDRKIQEELGKKKKKEKKTITTEEDFIKYAKDRRDKIWYHALNYLAFKVEDHTSSKYLLYDMLKQDTSKSPLDPLPEHQFYFGLGYLLRLNIENNQIVRYLGAGKFRIQYDIESIKKIIEEAGPPIITKPIIKDETQKKYFKDFLSDDFSDI